MGEHERKKTIRHIVFKEKKIDQGTNNSKFMKALLQHAYRDPYVNKKGTLDYGKGGLAPLNTKNPKIEVTNTKGSSSQKCQEGML